MDRDGLILGTYRRVGEPIYTGGMGVVTRVHHIGWDMDLAMKTPRLDASVQDDRTRPGADFQSECKLWRSLGLHPHIVPCYYVRKLEGAYAIFMDWEPGGSLRDHMRDGSLYAGDIHTQQKRLLGIAIQAAWGLDYAHHAPTPMLHLDVKPENILVGAHFHTRITDFGLACPLQGSQPIQVHCDSGSPYYRPSDQIRGEVQRYTDIFSWAVTVMELFLKTPRDWKSGYHAGVQCAQILANCALPLPEGLGALLQTCMQTEPAARYQSFTPVLEALFSIYESLTGTPYAQAAPQPAPDTAGTRNNYALSLLDLGEQAQATEMLDDVIACYPGHLPALYNRMLQKLRQCPESARRETLLQALCAVYNAPLDPQAIRLLCQLYGEAGYWAEARTFLEQSLQRLQAPDALPELDAITAQISRGGAYTAPWEICRVRSYREQMAWEQRAQKALQTLRQLLEHGEIDQAATHLRTLYLQGALYSEEGQALQRRIAARCAIDDVLSFWPYFQERLDRCDTVSLDNPGQLFCGGQIFDLSSRTWIASHRDALQSLHTPRDGQQTLAQAMRHSHVCFSTIAPTGDRYLYAQAPECFYAIDRADGACLQTYPLPKPEPIRKLGYSRDAQRLYALTDTALYVYDAAGAQLDTGALPRQPLRDVDFAWDHRYLLLLYQHTLVVWDLARRARSLRVTLDPSDCQTVTADFAYAYIACALRGLWQVDLQSGEKQLLYQGHTHLVAMLHDRQHVLCATQDGEILVIDPAQKRVICTLALPDTPQQMAISRNGRYLAVAMRGQLAVYLCQYSYRYLPVPAHITPHARVQVRMHPAHTPEQILPGLLQVLEDCGLGYIDEDSISDCLHRVWEEEHRKKPKRRRRWRPALLALCLLTGGGVWVYLRAVREKPAVPDQSEISASPDLAETPAGSDLAEHAEIVLSGVNWTLDADGLLVFTGTGALSFDTDNPAWQASSVRAIEISEGITAIPEQAFSNLTALTVLSLPDTLQSIGAGAFEGCQSLTQVQLPAGLQELGARAFARTGLLSVQLPAGLKTLEDQVFYACQNLTDIELPGSLSHMELAAWEGCCALETLSVAPGNTQYTSIDGVIFSKDLTQLISYPAGRTDSAYTLPDTVTDICDRAFLDCVHLRAVTLPDGVHWIHPMAFARCTELTRIQLGSGLTHIDVQAFWHCHALRDVQLPEGLAYLNKQCFQYCFSLTSIELPDSVVYLGEGAFADCLSLASVRLSAGCPELGAGCFAYCSALETLSLPEGVRTVGQEACLGCQSLSVISLPHTLTALPASALRFCHALDTVRYSGTLADWDAMPERAQGSISPQAEILCADGSRGAGAIQIQPRLHLTDIPLYGEALSGEDWQVTLYLQVSEGGTAYVKPTERSPTVRILQLHPEDSEGTWSLDYATGEYDLQTIVLEVLLLPQSYTPTLHDVAGARAAAIDDVKILRDPDGGLWLSPAARF